MMQVDIDDLERRAQASLDEAPEDPSWFGHDPVTDEEHDNWSIPEDSVWEMAKRHIAANSPTVTLALVARIRELETTLGKVISDWEHTESVDLDNERVILEKGVVLP